VPVQVAACPDVQVVSPDDVPAEVIAKEREIEMGKSDLLGKPEQVRNSHPLLMHLQLADFSVL
jgi:elongation factor Ts